MAANNPFDEDYEFPRALRRGWELDRASVVAAHLLLMARQLVGGLDDPALAADAQALGVPRLPGFRGRSGRFVQRELDALSGRYASEYERTRLAGRPFRYSAESFLWDLSERDPLAAAALINLCATNGSRVDSVAASAAVLVMTGGESEVASRRLVEVAQQRSADVSAELALVALDGLSPQPDNAWVGLIDAAPTTSICIHGTWARLTSDWYRPGSELHSHIKKECSLDLYCGDDYYRWGGGYSPEARARACDDLAFWRAGHGISNLDTIYAHSHGGNVALDHIAAGAKAAMLVVMHTPFLRRTEADWAVISQNVGRIVVLRTRGDLVVMLDSLKSGSTALPPPSAANVRDIAGGLGVDFWFQHGTFTRLATWQKFSLSEEIRFERLMVS